MRGVGLTLVCTCALACAQPPTTAEGEGEAVGEGQSEGDEVPGEAEPRPASTATPAVDATLAQMRTQVRGGRLPDAARRALLDSPDPDHRHAARLLQAIAGEVPAAVLPRTTGGVGEFARAEREADDELTRPGSGEPEPSAAMVAGAGMPKPDPTASPNPTVSPNPTLIPNPTLSPNPSELPNPSSSPSPSQPPSPSPSDAPLDDRDAEPFDVVPDLAELVPGSPAWAWFASAGPPLGTRPEPEPESTDTAPTPTTEFGSPELPLLLRAPVLVGKAGPVRHPAPLVILTRLDLRAGASEDAAILELAGAGSVAVTTQPLSASGDRLRLWIADAGAVPAFTSARPALAALAVVGVDRRDRQVWIDVELAPGWALRGWQAEVNGATVSFARVVTPKP